MLLSRTRRWAALFSGRSFLIMGANCPAELRSNTLGESHGSIRRIGVPEPMAIRIADLESSGASYGGVADREWQACAYGRYRVCPHAMHVPGTKLIFRTQPDAR
jgi:hypothetical protein